MMSGTWWNCQKTGKQSAANRFSRHDLWLRGSLRNLDSTMMKHFAPLSDLNRSETTDGCDDCILEWQTGRGVYETPGGFRHQGSRAVSLQVEAKHLWPEAVTTMLEFCTG